MLRLESSVEGNRGRRSPLARDWIDVPLVFLERSEQAARGGDRWKMECYCHAFIDDAFAYPTAASGMSATEYQGLSHSERTELRSMSNTGSYPNIMA
jgi:hypothetical protein